MKLLPPMECFTCSDSGTWRPHIAHTASTRSALSEARRGRPASSQIITGALA